MHIGSGLNTVSSMYRQQKGNNMKAPVSAEKTVKQLPHFVPMYEWNALHCCSQL